MTDKPVETQETTMPTQEKWEIEVGTSREFADVSYSIRYPGGSFRVEQRVNVKQGGYKLAHERLQRIVAKAVSPSLESTPAAIRLLALMYDRWEDGTPLNENDASVEKELDPQS